jgi:hypothetical protein
VTQRPAPETLGKVEQLVQTEITGEPLCESSSTDIAVQSGDIVGPKGILEQGCDP